MFHILLGWSMKEDEMGMYGEMRNSDKILVGEPEGINQLGI
jgi:hypothetical protein